MPYRSILITVVTVMLALLAAGMYARSIASMLLVVNASTQPSTQPGNSHPGVTFPTTSSTQPAARPDREFKALVKLTMIATFVIVCLLFVIGFFTTLRSWMRAPKPKPTRYVDAWKLAGERLRVESEPEGSGDSKEHG
jgi:hypothetical protein